MTMQNTTHAITVVGMGAMGNYRGFCEVTGNKREVGHSAFPRKNCKVLLSHIVKLKLLRGQ